MSVPEDTSGTVRFTVKELLARMDGKLDKIHDDLASKAESVEVAALEQRVEKLELWRSLLTGAYAAGIIAVTVYAAVDGHF